MDSQVRMRMNEIIAEVQRQLDSAALQQDLHLRIRPQDSTFEDDWFYIGVEPGRPGEHASDHAKLMSDIEKDLWRRGPSNVLLVPVISD